MKTGLRVGWLPQSYEARVASVRIRCLNSIRELRRRGFPVELYRERHALRYTVVIFSKTYRNRDIELVKRLKSLGVKIIFDLCDNHFLKEEKRVVRLKQMLCLADHWVVSSDELADVVRAHFGPEKRKSISVIEDAVEESIRKPLLNIWVFWEAIREFCGLMMFFRRSEDRDRARLVWFGNSKGSFQDSGMAHVSRLKPLLERLNERYPLMLTVISNSRASYETIFSDCLFPTYYMAWNPVSFFAAMRRQRVAIIPIELNDFTKVKTNNRLIQSLFLGVGVVADSIRSYQEFSDCAFLDDWEHGLESYLAGEELLAQHLQCAQARIAERYSIGAIADRWETLFAAVHKAA